MRAESGMLAGDVAGAAEMSDDGLYRYTLTRVWETFAPVLSIVMLNPSTASGVVNDPTIGRCMSLARREQFGGILVVNLYAFRATKPADLWKAADPVGPENDAVLRHVLAEAGGRNAPVLCAWGANAKADRVAWFAEAAASARVWLHALGETKARAPRHPLYLPRDTPLDLWSGSLLTAP